MLEIHIEVANLKSSFELYSKLLPHSAVTWWEEKDAVAFVLEDGSAFGLWEKGKKGIHAGRGAEHLHFAFQIEPEEYESYKIRIESAGLTPLEYLWPEGHKSVYFFDYDGNQGEFMTADWFRK